MHAEDPGVRALPGWRRMTDYQLCSWYAGEIEARQTAWRARAQELGIEVLTVALADLGSPSTLSALARLVSGAELPAIDQAALHVAQAARQNPLVDALADRPERSQSPDQDAQEAAVERAVEAGDGTD